MFVFTVVLKYGGRTGVTKNKLRKTVPGVVFVLSEMWLSLVGSLSDGSTVELVSGGGSDCLQLLAADLDIGLTTRMDLLRSFDV